MKLLDIPTINISQFSPNSDEDRTKNLQQLAKSISTALENHPHFVVVNGYPAIDDRENLTSLGQAICDVNSSPEKVSFTRVRINQTKANFDSTATRYSRTHLPLIPHTDSSYNLKPHEVVAFQCIVSDETGGESIIIPVEDILEKIDSNCLELLHDRVYPFEEDSYPIIFGESGDEHIRYYRAQIDRTIGLTGKLLSEQHRNAIDQLDNLLQSTELGNRVHLQPGQIIFAHNTKVLHGRTGFSPESDRLLLRIRLHIPSLAAQSLKQGEQREQREQGEQGENQKSIRHSDVKQSTKKKDTSKSQLLGEAEEQLDLALENKDRRNLQDAFKHFQNALKLEPNSLEILSEFGDFLLEIGQFDIATKIFRRCLEIDPQDFYCNLELSSLFYEKEEYDKAQEILKTVAHQHPYIIVDKPEPEKLNILRIRSLQGSKYKIIHRKNGGFKSLLQGGHFSIRDLVEHEKYNIALLNIYEENLDQLQDIPNFDILLNTIACPDLMRVPLLSAARFRDRFPHIPVINDPRKVLETTRERNSIKLNMIEGVTFPKTEKIRWDGVSFKAISKEILGLGFTFPFIIRLVGSQTGTSVSLINSEQALNYYLQQSPQNRDYYVIQFHDCRQTENIFNKTRVFFIDGNFYPVANLFNSSWNIHSGDRYEIMDKTQWTQDAEQSFLNDPISYLGQENFDKLCKIRDLIDLDFFGIDFTITPDGTLFIFELNSAMRHNFDHAGNFPYTRPHLERISAAFDTMIQNRL
ncbi:MAG: TauD/TfdA family dioxygenase [Xenococcus sp. (in: cyanobacteria)]